MQERALRHIFLVATSMQYVNALEAVAAFDADPRASLLIAPSAMFRLDTVTPDAWGAVGQYSHSRDIGWLSRIAGFSRIGRASRALDHIAKFRSLIPDDLNPVDFFVGNLLDKRVRHLANTLPVRQLIVLDDGVATVELARTLRDRRRERGLNAWASRLLRLQTDYPAEGTLFTTYDVELPAGWTRRENTYAVLREKMSATQLRDEALFVGGPFVRVGWLTLDAYVELVRRSTALARAPVTYVPHRHESQEIVDAIVARVTPRIWRPQGALEPAMIREQRIPKEVIGFVSSVLPNVHNLFGGRCKVRSVQVDFPDARPERQASMRQLYAFFRGMEDGDAFCVVDLAPITPAQA